MDILGVGPLELLFILLIALIVLGPTDMVKAGRTLGRFLRRIVTSQAWQEVTRLRTLPNRLMREAGLDEDFEQIKGSLQQVKEASPKDMIADINAELREAEQAFPEWTLPEQRIEPPPASSPQLEEAAAVSADDPEANAAQPHDEPPPASSPQPEEAAAISAGDPEANAAQPHDEPEPS